jgi:hypothetical protein
MSQHSNHICPECGKYIPFSQTYGWGYAINGMYTCSYHCMRAIADRDAWRIKREFELAARNGVKYTKVITSDFERGGIGMRLSQEQADMIRRMHEEGATQLEIAKKVNTSTTTVRHHIRKLDSAGQPAQEQPAKAVEPTVAREEPPAPDRVTVQLTALQLLDSIVKLLADVLKEG